MMQSRVPAGVTAAGVGIGGRFAPSAGQRPPAGSLTSPQGSFLYPPASFRSVDDYIDFWFRAPASDQLLTQLVKAREKWRTTMVQGAREQLVAEWESQPRIRRMARRDPEFYAAERAARENATGPENWFPPLTPDVARPVAVAHQIWTKTHLVPNLSRNQVAGVVVPVPSDPHTTVQDLITRWDTEEWAHGALGGA